MKKILHLSYSVLNNKLYLAQLFAHRMFTSASNENLDTGIFSGPPCTSKCLQPAVACTNLESLPVENEELNLKTYGHNFFWNKKNNNWNN